jgi:hypothetical protein
MLAITTGLSRGWGRANREAKGETRGNVPVFGVRSPFSCSLRQDQKGFLLLCRCRCPLIGCRLPKSSWRTPEGKEGFSMAGEHHLPAAHIYFFEFLCSCSFWVL